MSAQTTLFQDRVDAGRQLAARLRPFAGALGAAPLVLGLPRGGVPVAYEVARELRAPLDVCVVRKIGAPDQPELGVGAVAEEGAVYVDRSRIGLVGLSELELARLVDAKRAEVAARVRLFRGGAAAHDVRGRTILVVDDGIATGGTARAAIESLRARGAARIVLAVPVAASRSLKELEPIADEIVCLYPKDDFYAVGLWYDDFSATTDDEVVALLELARTEQAWAAERPSERVVVPVDRDVRIELGDAWLDGRLTRPSRSKGLVLFAHGTGSSRHSARNRYVAGELQRQGVATLLFDLLTADEERADMRTRALRFDIGRLAERLVAATDWAVNQPETRGLPIGYFGASTGAAAALVAASLRIGPVRAVVSRGGRPDLAGGSLALVQAPTLLIVGGDDTEVLRVNREAMGRLVCKKSLEIVPRATHLFEEAGTLEQVARLAARWFARYLGSAALEATA